MTTVALPFSRQAQRTLTMERLLYGVLILIPTLVRWLHLGQRTLAPAEAATAWRAWQISQGAHPALHAGQPLLLALQSLTFFVIGATDATARFWPLIAVALIPAGFYGARHWLGRGPALMAATLLTFSPTVNAFARRGDGTAFALAAAIWALAGWAWVQEARPYGWKVLALALGTLGVSGPAGFPALLAVGLLLALAWRTEPPPLPFSSKDGLWFLLPWLVAAVFGLRWDALGLVAINLDQWLHGLAPSPRAWLLAWVRMAVDEPVLSLFGLMGILWGLQRPGRPRQMALAALVAGVLALAQGADGTSSRALAACFLALPAAWFLVRLLQTGHLHFYSLEQTLLVVVLILLAFLSVYALVSFAASGDFARLLVFAVSIGLALVMVLVFFFFIGWREVRAGVAISTLLLTVLFSLSSLWALAFNATLPTLARIFPTESLPDIPDLVRTYGDLSQHQRGDRWALPVRFVPGSAADDVILWYFRRAQDFRVVEDIPPDTQASLVIMPQDHDPMPEGYAGQAFVTLTDWDVDKITTANQGIYWLFFRRSPWPPPAVDGVHLWVDLSLLSLSQDTSP